MGYFREKNMPLIEAEKWNPYGVEENGLIDQGFKKMLLRTNEDKTLLIKGLYGHYNAEPGDWIVKGHEGNLYICKPEIFENEYAPVEPMEPASEIVDDVNTYEEEKASIQNARILVERQCPDCRERSIVLRKLDEAFMWMEQMQIEAKD